MEKVAWQERARALLAPIVTILEDRGVTPTQITLFGLGMHVLSAVIIGAGQALVGGLVLLLAAVCDGMDGMLARRTGRVTRFGAFLDSTVDRIDETVIMAGIACYFLVAGGTANQVWAVVVVIALGGSLITSYARARAEGLGLECKVGAFERPERVVVTVAGLLFGHVTLVIAVLVLTVLSWYTVYQRVRHVHGLVGDQPLEPSDATFEETPARLEERAESSPRPDVPPEISPDARPGGEPRTDPPV